MCSRDRSIRWLRGRGREIRSFPARFMYKELKMLFGGKKPSVRKFNLALRALSLEEQNRYYKVAYDAAFTEWDTLSQSYRTFLRDLLLHDKQRTADYLRRETVLGVLAYPLREPELLRRVFALLEQGYSVVPASGVCPVTALPLHGDRRLPERQTALGAADYRRPVRTVGQDAVGQRTGAGISVMLSVVKKKSFRIPVMRMALVNRMDLEG